MLNKIPLKEPESIVLASGLSLKVQKLLSSQVTGAWTFSPPTFSPSDNSAHTVGPSDNWTLKHFDPYLFGPCIV
jgi:hypothetical protein